MEEFTKDALVRIMDLCVKKNGSSPEAIFPHKTLEKGIMDETLELLFSKDDKEKVRALVFRMDDFEFEQMKDKFEEYKPLPLGNKELEAPEGYGMMIEEHAVLACPVANGLQRAACLIIASDAPQDSLAYFAHRLENKCLVYDEHEVKLPPGVPEPIGEIAVFSPAGNSQLRLLFVGNKQADTWKIAPERETASVSAVAPWEKIPKEKFREKVAVIK